MIASQYSAVEQIAPPGPSLTLRPPQANDVPLTLSHLLSTGRVFVKAPLQAYENLADYSRPFEELRSASPLFPELERERSKANRPLAAAELDGNFIDVPRDQALVNDIPMYSLEFRLLQLLLATSFLAPWSEMEPILAAVRSSSLLPSTPWVS